MARASIAFFLIVSVVNAAEKQKVGVVVGHDASLSFSEGAPRKSSALVRRAERRAEQRQPDDVLQNDPREEEQEGLGEDHWRSSSHEGEERSSVEDPSGSIDNIFNDPIFKNHGRRSRYGMDYDDQRDGDHVDEARHHGQGYGHRRGEDEYGSSDYGRPRHGDEYSDDRYEHNSRYGRESEYERDRERERARESPYDRFGENYPPRQHASGAYLTGPHNEEEAVQEAEKVDHVMEEAMHRAGLSMPKQPTVPLTMNADLADKEEFSLAWLGCIFVVAAGGFMLGWRMRSPEKPQAATVERSEPRQDDEGEQSSSAAPRAAGDAR